MVNSILSVFFVLLSISACASQKKPSDDLSQAGATVIGKSCISKESKNLCLGMKYVVYFDKDKKRPVVYESEAVKNIYAINSLWKQCGIAFQIEQYLPAVPTDYQLSFVTADSSDLNEIRSHFEDGKHLLVVTTGPWDRNGSLGDTEANAWTSMPGTGLYGAILEAPVGTFSNIIAHELGHYLSLDHSEDSSDLMSPIIYDSSTQLSEEECQAARESATHEWAPMLRS